MQALADMLSVNIDVLTTIRADVRPVSHYTCRGKSVGTITVGLIAEEYYVGLEKLQTTNIHEEQSSQESANVSDSANQDQLPTNPSLANCKLLMYLTKPVRASQKQTNSVTTWTRKMKRHNVNWFRSEGCLMRVGSKKKKLSQMVTRSILLLPSEDQTPMNMFTDDYFEEMSNPTKYPFGSGGINTHRERSITIRNYFNQRLLHVDGRFAKDIEYLLAAQ